MSGLLRSSAVFSAMTLLSRIAGFVRDMLQGMLFGTGGAMSAFIVAYRIPNFLRRVFAEGSMAMAFVPVLNEIKQRGDRAALKDFIDHMAGALLTLLKWWLAHDMPYTPARMDALYRQLVMPGVNAVLAG